MPPLGGAGFASEDQALPQQPPRVFSNKVIPRFTGVALEFFELKNRRSGGGLTFSERYDFVKTDKPMVIGPAIARIHHAPQNLRKKDIGILLSG